MIARSAYLSFFSSSLFFRPTRWRSSSHPPPAPDVHILISRLPTVVPDYFRTFDLLTTQVLYRLLSNPEYTDSESLRQEVDAVIKEGGWTKDGIDKTYKVGSLLRGTQQFDDFSSGSL